MINKQVCLEKIQCVHDIMSRHGLDVVTADAEAKLTEEVKEYAFRVLMIGGFSSGKSAFLNTLIQRKNTLIEGQAPETTIATELKYGREECIEAVSASGKRQRFPLSEGNSFSPKDWRYLVYHLDCEYLRKHPDIILVDMPGLDSNMEWHNKAIAQYITKGSAYILLVSCKDGTLKESTLDFLREAAQYPQSLACFVSMSDLEHPTVCEQVVEEVAQGIQAFYNTEIPVSSISVFDADFQEKADATISGFDLQDLFLQKFRDPIEQLAAQGRTALQTAKNAAALDVKEIDQRIAACTKSRDELRQQLAKERRIMERDYGEKVIPAIRQDIEAALTAQAERLAQAVVVSPEAFNSAVNSILRPVILRSTQQHVEGNFEEFVQHWNLSFLGEDSEDIRQDLTQGLQRIVSSLENFQRHYGEQKEGVKPTGKAFSTIASALAIATNYINPVIELIIVFLPTIFSFFSKPDQQDKDHDLQRKVQNVIIPDIVEKLMPEIVDAVGKTRDAMLQELEEQMNGIITAQEEALAQAQEEKRQKTTQFQDRQALYDQDIKTLEQIWRQ